MGSRNRGLDHNNGDIEACGGFYGGLEASPKLLKLNLRTWNLPQGEGGDSTWSDEHSSWSPARTWT